MEKFKNHLASETSPYLLQHANNPVNWFAWNTETLAKAKKENKLLLISIGYSSCHWCHVMEKESFENEAVAEIMNHHYINVKVDREERPDIDQIYMNAVQLMTGAGGWPLNCIALPDGRPVWGGTYFKKKEWSNILHQIGELYRKNPEKVVEYAEKLTEGIQQSGLITLNPEKALFTKEYLNETVKKWSIYFDEELGGFNKAPKFPMPNNYHFLLRHAYQNNDKSLLKYVNTTLTKIALGGIFDHVGGGFSRYSVDTKWHIPHFEKMLYDNGQLVSLFADAYLITKNQLYKETVYDTLQFIERELLDGSGGFYTAIDADSLNAKNELEEGAFYVWKKEELQTVLKEDFVMFSEYYNINSYGFWEQNNYHLIKNSSDTEFAKKHNLAISDLKNNVVKWKAILLKERAKRAYPRLDDKVLTSWNGIMLKGYVDAYRVFNDNRFLKIALKNAHFLELKMLKEDGTLYRNYKNGKASINGYLEDYGMVIDAFISLYEVTLDEKWLMLSKNLTDTCFDYFFNTATSMFYFTSNKDLELITRKTETEDNVMPSSNSMMAKNLFKLSHYFENEYYLKTSKQMLNNMTSTMQNFGSAYSNWLEVYSNFIDNYFEIAISGANAKEKLLEIHKEYIPNKLICGSVTKSSLPLLKNRFIENKTLMYICKNKTCNLPTEITEEAICQLKNYIE
ncbi:thioredoxin domain-containing protein [Polaribacter uvawellassae]|uniref:thioredoxin domain-containing protein n=1 Tax=Polaribacter uvawellassae TaxID=3133495 RepID=UPI003219D89B